MKTIHYMFMYYKWESAWVKNMSNRYIWGESKIRAKIWKITCNDHWSTRESFEERSDTIGSYFVGYTITKKFYLRVWVRHQDKISIPIFMIRYITLYIFIFIHTIMFLDLEFQWWNSFVRCLECNIPIFFATCIPLLGLNIPN